MGVECRERDDSGDRGDGEGWNLAAGEGQRGLQSVGYGLI